MEHDLAFLRRQLAERHVGPHAEFTCDVLHQRPHERLPRTHRALVDRQRLVRNQRGFVDHIHDARAVALPARALAVERQFLRARRKEFLAALGANQLLFRGDRQRRRVVMPVRAAVAGEAREHQSQAIEQFRPGAERAADARNARPLMQRQGRRHVQHVVHLRLRRLRHAPPCVSREGFQVTPRTLRVQHAERERRFAGPGHARDPDDLIKRDLDVDVFQVVNSCSAHQHFVLHQGLLSFLFEITL